MVTGAEHLHSSTPCVNGVNNDKAIFSSNDGSKSSGECDVITDDNELIKPVLCTLPDDVNASQRARIEALLLRHANLFARHEYDVGGTSLIKYRLELKDPNSQPVREPLRQHPVAYLDLIDKEIDRLLSAGLIERCNSTYASNVVLVKRKLSPDAPPGTAPRLRITVDYRALNSDFRQLARSPSFHYAGLF
jgi:hypothetical protein